MVEGEINMTNTVAAKDGLCGNCAHAEICVYRTRYNSAQSTVNSLLSIELDWAKITVIGCRHYLPNVNTVRRGEHHEIHRG